MTEQSLATELLHEVKLSARRWFIAFLVMVIVEVGTIIGFMWYISLPVEETIYTYDQNVEEVEGSTVRQIIGGDLDD